MKKLVLLFLCVSVSVILSCKKHEKNNYLIFSGKIINPNSDTISILSKNLKLIKSIHLMEDNSFTDTMDISEAYYVLSDGKEETNIYLKHGFDLDMFLDTKEFDESIVYKGIGSGENNYLAKKALLREGFGKLNYVDRYANLNEQEFLKSTDSLFNLEYNLLKNQKNLNADFIFIETKTLEFGKADRLSTYEDAKRYFTDSKDFKVSESYPDPCAELDFTNEKLLISPNYLSLVESCLGKKVGEKIKNDKNADYVFEFVESMLAEVKSNKILEELAYRTGKWNLNYTKKLDSVYEKIKPLLTNENYLAEVTEKYKTLKRVEKGAISPTFQLTDIHENTISLAGLKGNLVYIDVWATWCAPCVKEIPDLKELEKHFKDDAIKFVSICKSDTKERWKKMVEEKELGGIQLFAHDDNIDFFKDYLVEGIPRFILIDKEGKIIDANAKRPSNPELKEELINLL